METLSLLRLTPLRLLGLLLVSAVGSFIAATLVMDQPSTYTSTSTAFVGSALPPEASAFDVGPFVSDFEAAIELPGIRSAVAEEAGIPEADLDLTTNRNGEGSSVNVTSVHHDSAVAEQTATRAASSALMFLAGQQSTESSQLVVNRSADVEAARAALTAFETENNFVDPVKEYEILQQQAIELRLQADDRSNDYTIAQRQALLEQVSSIRQSLPTLATQRDEITKLRDELARSEQKLRDAENARTGVESAVAGASGDSVIPAAAEEQSKIPQVVQAVVATTIVVFGLGIAMFFLADALLKRSRRSKEPVQAAAKQTDRTASKVLETDRAETVVTAAKKQSESQRDEVPAAAVETARPAAPTSEPVTSRSQRKTPPVREEDEKAPTPPTPRGTETSNTRGNGVRQPPAKSSPPIAKPSTRTPAVPKADVPKADVPKVNVPKASSNGAPAKVGASSNGVSSSLPDKPSTGLERPKTPRKITKRNKNDENGSDGKS